MRRSTSGSRRRTPSSTTSSSSLGASSAEGTRSPPTPRGHAAAAGDAGAEYLSLTDLSQFPHYFGEISLWTGIAIASAGVLLSRPAQLALGLPGGLTGAAVALSAASVSPLFDWFVLTRLSGIPLSEEKYDRLYGDRRDYQEWKKNTPKLIPRLW